ncbi:MAG: hydrolase, partial [Rhodoferax sp.]|nr:hydrolase [Rhodoferax sp.]
MKKRILCFGDSLTWGWKPTEAGIPVERYAQHTRWTGVLAQQLGQDFDVIEEGLCGRTTDLNDPLDPRLDGAAYLPSALASHLPLDLVVIMLGTNDTKVYFNRSPFEIAAAVGKLVGQVMGSGVDSATVYPAPKVLLVAPPPVAEAIAPAWFAELFVGARGKMQELSAHLQNLAKLLQIPFFDA